MILLRTWGLKQGILPQNHFLSFQMPTEISWIEGTKEENILKDFISCVYLLLLVASNSALFRYYQDLPPVAKAYGVLCLMTSGGYHLGLYNPWDLALFYGPVIKRFQVKICCSDDQSVVWPLQHLNYLKKRIWKNKTKYQDGFRWPFRSKHSTCLVMQVWRLVTNFFFLGPFSLTFAFRLLLM